jgi:hypothetical protein
MDLISNMFKYCAIQLKVHIIHIRLCLPVVSKNEFLLPFWLQGLIGQYAVPILEEKSVWGTDAPTRIAYMDTQVIFFLPFH